MTFEFSGPEPLYAQLADEIQRRIAAGRYPVGQRIPSEAEIRAEFGVGRTTTRAAVEILRERGHVVTAKGRGTFVVRPADGDTSDDTHGAQRGEDDGGGVVGRDVAP